MSLANYKPSNWDITIVPAIKKCQETIMSDQEVNLISVAVEMISLDIYDEMLFEKILSVNYLEGPAFRRKRTVDYLNLLKLYQSVQLYSSMHDGVFDGIINRLQDSADIKKAIELNLKDLSYPLKRFLIQKLGEDKVLSGVKTKYAHSIQHVIKVDKISGEIIPFTKNESYNNDLISLEDISCSEECVL